MSPLILDTDTFSEVLVAKNPSVVTRATEYLGHFGNFTISALTYFETQKGLVHKPKPKVIWALGDLMSDLIVLPTRKEEAELGGTIHGLLKQQGLVIGEIDPIIAATAITYGLTLATGNTDHYQRVVNLGFPLQILNWRQD